MYHLLQFKEIQETTSETSPSFHKLLYNCMEFQLTELFLPKIKNKK